MSRKNKSTVKPQQPVVKIGSDIGTGTVIDILTDGVVYRHPTNDGDIKLSFAAIESMVSFQAHCEAMES